MKIGTCRGLDDFAAIKDAAEAGVDYYECGFGNLVNLDEEKFQKAKKMLDEYNIPVYAANGFLPGDLKVVGDNIDYEAIEAYLDKGFERAKELNIKVIVFGSGAARSYPDGYSHEKATEQLAFFLKEYASPKAEEAGCTIVMEPLRFGESKMIHTVKDGVEIGEKSGKNNVLSLADLYHVYGNDDKLEEIASFYGKVYHSHIAEPVNRTYPFATDSDEVKVIYKAFISALKGTGCETVSIEARTDDYANDIKNSVKFLREII